jgi:hypothetical protein
MALYKESRPSAYTAAVKKRKHIKKASFLISYVLFLLTKIIKNPKKQLFSVIIIYITNTFTKPYNSNNQSIKT